METLHIHRMLDSETIPELKPLLGRTVEIIVHDRSTPHASHSGISPGTGDWTAFEQAVESLRNSYDFDAVRLQDESDWREAGK